MSTKRTQGRAGDHARRNGHPASTPRILDQDLGSGTSAWETPIVVWRDGKVVWIPAEEIEIPNTEPKR